MTFQLEAQQLSELQALATPNTLRTSYDVGYYHLDLAIDFDKKSISGFVDMKARLLEPRAEIAMDLAQNLSIDSVLHDGKSCAFSRTKNSRGFKILFNHVVEPNAVFNIRVYYHGQPQIAKNAPWDGGFSWAKDTEGNPWLGVSCQGDGASLWWPNKDLLYDEADSVSVTCHYPNTLFFVSNGNLISDYDQYGRRSTTWKTSYPINNYNLSLNIADYAHFSEVYERQNDEDLEMDYYVLKPNLNKAKRHFKQAKTVIKVFENAFGKYPFQDDGYALVETPYLG
ncbi:MAG: M1 family peptidase, partial [Flavobacteriales bacterium]